VKYVLFRILTLSFVLLPIISVQAQNFSRNVEAHWPSDLIVMEIPPSNFIGIPNETPESLRTVNFSDTNYVLNLCSMESKLFNFGLKIRLEDELPYENNAYVYPGFFYFDFELNYSFKAFNFSFGLENLLGLNNPDVSILPEVVRQTQAYNEVIFVYDSAYLISACLTYNF